MNSRKAKQLRRKAEQLSQEMGFDNVVEYQKEDVNRSDMGVFCSPKEGKTTTLTLKPDTVRAVYKELKRSAKASPSALV